MNKERGNPPPSVGGAVNDRDSGHAIAWQRVMESHLLGHPLAVIWIDINRFHAVNHSFGYPAGDYLVRVVADRISAVVRGKGDIARMSGDEFLVILPKSDLDAALDVVHELEMTISRAVDIEGVRIHPTLSTGVAIFENGEDPVQLLLRADRAKDLAKKRVGNSHHVSGEGAQIDCHHLDRREFEVEAKLHKAIETGGMQLYYQPIMRRDGSIEALEALLRCFVDGEYLPPSLIIPVAEKTGLIFRIGEWTLSTGAALARKLEMAGNPVKVAVNVSRAQLLSPTFIESLHGCLICSNASPELLELELTESLFLDTAVVVQKNLREVMDTGVGLAIDDFGTGYSTLATLKDIPATKIKMDKSFIDALPHDKKGVAVVRAITSLGQELGLTVVAEGVEREEQKTCLEGMNIDALQGYLFSRPVPIEQLYPSLMAHH